MQEPRDIPERESSPARASRETASGTDAPTSDDWGLSNSEAIFMQVLPEPRWAVPGLELGPGRPCGLWGKPGAGKTLYAQELALAVATGSPAFGRFEVRRGRVLHVSYDFGNWAIRTRYRQLANGRGIDFGAVEGMIETAVFPNVYLNSQGAEAKFAARCNGFDLVLIDCFRDSVPGEDENDSGVARFLKSLARVSESSGSTFLYLHHTKKGDQPTDVDSGRGSGAIAAGSGTIWSVEGSGRNARTIRHVRAHDASRGFQEPFYVELVANGAERRFETEHSPFQLLARSDQDMAKEQFFARVETNKAEARSRLKLLVDLVSSHPNCSTRDLREHTKGTPLSNRDTLKNAIDAALEHQPPLIVRSPRKGRGGDALVFNIPSRVEVDHD
ncbi:MAG TPA: AAA family ATPase [Polyangiaceae bacterium]|nr:AAA family ATPase [Polyangiaceae bacterium]